MSSMFAFMPQYESLSEVLMDQKLAKLGDAYVNFLYACGCLQKGGIKKIFALKD